MKNSINQILEGLNASRSINEGETKKYRLTMYLNIKDGDDFYKGELSSFPYNAEYKELKLLGDTANINFEADEAKTKVLQKVKDWAYQNESRIFDTKKCRIKKVEVK